MLIQLDKRLAEIAAMVEDGARLADIGTDHGYLVAQLVQSGKVPFAYACDINERPLESARRLIEEQGLSSQVQCLLCDGLDAVPRNMVDTIVIAGMGGDLISRIIENAEWVRHERYHLLLQPMTKFDHLREYLAHSGFETIQENAVRSKRFVYTVFSVRYSGRPHKIPPLERYIGKVMLGDTKDTSAYLKRVRANLRQRIEGISRANSPDDRIDEYRTVLAEIERLLEGF